MHDDRHFTCHLAPAIPTVTIHLSHLQSFNYLPYVQFRTHLMRFSSSEYLLVYECGEACKYNTVYVVWPALCIIELLTVQIYFNQLIVHIELLVRKNLQDCLAWISVKTGLPRTNCVYPFIYFNVRICIPESERTKVYSRYNIFKPYDLEKLIQRSSFSVFSSRRNNSNSVTIGSFKEVKDIKCLA